MFNLIKQAFIVLPRFSKSLAGIDKFSGQTKCLFLNDEPWLDLTDLNPIELRLLSTHD